MRRLALVLAAVAAVVLLLVVSTRAAAAAPGPSKGVLTVRPRGGPPPLALSRVAAGWEGELVLDNVGDGALTVSRVTVRSDDDDPRAPPGLSVVAVDALPLVIPAHTTKSVKVAWKPAADAHARQLFGHVVVTSSDEDRGEVAVGVVAEPRSALASHALAILLAVPIVGALIVLLARRLRPDDEHAPGRTAIACALVFATIAGTVFASFDPKFSRADGNDGLQMMERASWLRSLGSEWFLAVDGLTAAMLPALAIVVFISVAMAARDPQTRPPAVAAMLVAASGFAAALCARDLLLLTVSLAVGFSALTAAVALARPQAASAALRLAISTGAGLVLLGLAVAILYSTSTAAFLFDGSRAEHHFAMADLARTALVGKTVAGWPANKVAFVLAAAGIFALGASFPLHGWLAPTAAATSGPVATFVCALAPNIALVALLRVNYTLLPEAARWAEGPMVALGAVAVAYAALLALAERDWRRQLAYLTVAHTGLTLASLGSTTAQGIAGAVALLPAHAMSVAVALAAVAAIESRAGTTDLARLGGLGRAAPGFAVVVALSHASLAGLPGLTAFWGELLAASALAPSHFVQLSIAGVGVITVTGVVAMTLRRALGGELPRELAALAADEGGRLERVTGAELATIAPAVAALIAGCLYPQPLLACAANAAQLISAAPP